MTEESEGSTVFREAYFVVLALVLAFGILQFSGTVLETDQPVVSVISCSMYPEYDRGDVLGVNGVDYSSIQEDDVIVFDVPLETELEIQDQRYSIGEESSDTPLGSAKVLQVSENRARLQVDGTRYTVMDGASYTIQGEKVIVRDISGVGTPVVHRVINKEEDYLETKGDNNPQQLEFEKEIRPEQIHGKVFFRIPKIGAVKLLAMDLAGLTGRPFVVDTYSGCQ